MRDHEHFLPLGKQPSGATKRVKEGRRESLWVTDGREIEESQPGPSVTPYCRQTIVEAPHISWSIGADNGLQAGRRNDGTQPPSQRQVTLNLGHGPFEALPEPDSRPRHGCTSSRASR